MPTLLTLLSICAALLVGGAFVGWRERAAFGRIEGAFACKLRGTCDRIPSYGIPVRWPRRRSRAAWVHDVLIVHRGLLRPRTAAIPVRIPDDVIRHTSARAVRGLGMMPLVLRLRLDNGDLLEIAADEASRTLLVGPFLAAAIPGLPRAPLPRRRAG